MVAVKHIASCSFGKDSLAAIITRMEHGEPVDAAVYCRIMFNDTISAELPEHEEWIHCHAIPLLRSRYGIETTIVQSEQTYCDQFYAVRQKGGSVGEIYGWPIIRGPWCNDRLKMRPIRRWRQGAGEYMEIVGIAADEPKRAVRKTLSKAVLPLVDYGATEAAAFDICRRADLLSPAYSGDRQRLGCWFCHNQRIAELRRLRVEHPELWAKLLELDKDSPVTFKPGQTVCGFDQRFELEERQISLFG